MDFLGSAMLLSGAVMRQSADPIGSHRAAMKSYDGATVQPSDLTGLQRPRVEPLLDFNKQRRGSMVSRWGCASPSWDDKQIL